MSNFYRITKHPLTGKWERAAWIDRGDGYAIKFDDDPSYYIESHYKWEYRENNKENGDDQV